MPPVYPVYETQLTTEAEPLVTVDQVYSLVIKDLEDAVEALEGYEQTNKVEINKYVAQGYLASAYLTTGNYTGAVSAANDVINNPRKSRACNIIFKKVTAIKNR